MTEKKKYSILLVDDEASNLLTLNGILSQDYALVMAKTGQRALELASRGKPDLILLDVLMPGMDGFEVISRLQTNAATKDIPVIFVTGLTGEMDEEKAFATGAADYIKKPFSAAIVKMRVDAQINAIGQTRDNEALKRVDPLTGIANRRRFEEHLAMEWRRAIREKTTISFLLLDIDHFKTYVQSFGYAQGDRLIREVGQILAAAVGRPGDLAGRLDGKEFGVLMPSTHLSNALGVAEKIRARVEALRVADGQGKPTSATVSVSVVSAIPRVGENVSDFMARADAHLRAARTAGRNRVYAGETPGG